MADDENNTFVAVQQQLQIC